MICDDNDAVHQTLRLYLKEAGFHVVSVYDGIAALEMLKTQKVDLVILDIMLPKLFGTEVCRQIRKTSDLPIIILNAKVDESDRIVGLELGADDYVTKPFSPREVVTRVRTVLLIGTGALPVIRSPGWSSPNCRMFTQLLESKGILL